MQRERLSTLRRLAQHRRSVRPSAKLGIAIRADDEKRRVAQTWGERLGEQKRRHVGIVQIVEHERQRPVGCEMRQEAPYLVEEKETIVRRIKDIGRSWRRHPEMRRQLRDELAEAPGG